MKERKVNKERFFKVSDLRAKYICPARKCRTKIISRDTAQGVYCPECGVKMEKFGLEG